MSKLVFFLLLFFCLFLFWSITPASPFPVCVYTRSGVQFFCGTLKVLFGDGESVHIFLNEESVPMVLSCAPIPLFGR